jgi:ribosomal-protein-alanine N-acetyltransferase
VTTDPPLPETVVTDRLRLVLITPEDAAGMLAGKRRVSWHRDYPQRADVDVASLVKQDDPDACWGPRHLVRAGDGCTVGSIGFFGPPEGEEPEVEVGFRLVAEARGHGAVTEALTALLGFTDAVGVRVRASVRPEDAEGLRALATCGFTELRGSTPEGELVMVRPVDVAGSRRVAG